MDSIAVFMIVAVVIALMVSIITSTVYIVAMLKLLNYIRELIEEKE